MRKFTLAVAIGIAAALCGHRAAVRQGDDQFADIVRWTLYAVVEAEEYGIASRNVDEMPKSSRPTIRSILGVTPSMGKALGVDDK